MAWIIACTSGSAQASKSSSSLPFACSMAASLIGPNPRIESGKLASSIAISSRDSSNSLTQTRQQVLIVRDQLSLRSPRTEI